MLQFILGRIKSGKTYEITERICADVKAGKRPVLIVTEQFSFESERNILKTLGDNLAKQVSVVSFTRLCDEIERETGGCCGKVLEDCDKTILINRALKASREELVLWKKYVNSSSFAASLLSIIAEFKLNAVAPEDIERVIDNVSDDSLKNKLHDISVVFRNYDLLITDNFIDPDSRLDKLYTALKQSDYFKGRPVYINSFFGFTGQQYKIIERIMQSAESVTVAFTDDVTDTRALSLVYNIRKCENMLKKLAKKHNIAVAKDIVLGDSRYSNDQLKNVESIMYSGKLKNENIKGENVFVCRADTVYDEAQFAVRNIRRLVREKGAKYSDFIVIARDVEAYEEAFSNACRENNVNCFIDKKIPLSSMPVSSAALCAAELALGMTSEKILKFLKSGIGILNAEEIAAIENYVFVWNIKGSNWGEDWLMTPSGLVRAQDDRNEKAKEQLKFINELRKKAIIPILRFKKEFSGTPKQRAAAIVKLFEECNAAESFKQIALAYKEDDPALFEAQAQGWSLLMKALDSLCVCFKDADITAKEFYEALKTALEGVKIGITPQMADEVTFGSADRIRPARPKYAFIMGANQGVFPRGIQKGGILNIAERQKLIDNQIGISDDTVSAAVDEEYLVYSNVCCPSDMLFISYNEGTGSGEISRFVDDIRKNIKCVELKEPDALSRMNLPETENAAFTEYCKRKSVSVKESETLKRAVTDPKLQKRIAATESGVNQANFAVSEETAKKLYGKNVRLSPSRIEAFEKCKFMYFCKYGLGAKKLQSAAFDAMQRGTIAHFVMQMLIEQYGKSLKDLTDSQIESEVSRLCEEYLDGVEGYRMAEDAYANYLVSTLKSALCFVVKRMRNEFLQSDFEPVKCELEIDYGGDIEPIRLAVEEGITATLIGKIDRIDKWNGYVRIIDYKSRKKTLSIPDIVIGKNLQMLLYLYTVCGNKTYGGDPAGVFYLSMAKYKADKASDAKLSGIALSDEEVRNAMDKTENGEFLPKMSKSGENKNFAEKEDFGIIFNYVENRLKDSAKTIISGDIAAKPIGSKSDHICEYCDFKAVCHSATDEPEAVPKLKKSEALEIMGKKV